METVPTSTYERSEIRSAEEVLDALQAWLCVHDMCARSAAQILRAALAYCNDRDVAYVISCIHSTFDCEILDAHGRDWEIWWNCGSWSIPANLEREEFLALLAQEYMNGTIARADPDGAWPHAHETAKYCLGNLSALGLAETIYWALCNAARSGKEASSRLAQAENLRDVLEATDTLGLLYTSKGWGETASRMIVKAVENELWFVAREIRRFISKISAARIQRAYDSLVARR